VGEITKRDSCYLGGGETLRIGFRTKPWDLYALIFYAIGLAIFLLAVGTGNVAAIVLVLFLPGYMVVAALFPRKDEIDWTERLVLSFGLTIVVIPLLGLALNFTPYGIHFASIMTATSLFIVVVGLVAHARRARIPIEQRLSGEFDLTIPGWKGHSRLDKALTVGLAIGVVAAAAFVVDSFASSRPEESFTEFYIVGLGGNASGYPTSLNVSQEGDLVLGISNHEHARVNYTVRIDLVELRMTFNATLGINQTADVNRTTVYWFNVTLGDGQNWTQPYAFRIGAVGLWKIQLFLLRDGSLSSVYREVHIIVRVV